jgi:hypothetical protein
VDESCMRHKKDGKHCPDDVKALVLRGMFAWSLVAPGQGEEGSEDPCRATSGPIHRQWGKIIFRATQNIVTGNVVDLVYERPRDRG